MLRLAYKMLIQASCVQDERYTDGYFTNDRSPKLFYGAAFPLASVSLRGVVFFLHGIGEHSLRFTHVYKHLCANGYGVIAYDMLGHGQSECEKPGLQLEILLKVKLGANSKFRFLDSSHELHGYYCFLRDENPEPVAARKKTAAFLLLGDEYDDESDEGDDDKSSREREDDTQEQRQLKVARRQH